MLIDQRLHDIFDMMLLPDMRSVVFRDGVGLSRGTFEEIAVRRGFRMSSYEENTWFRQ